MSTETQSHLDSVNVVVVGGVGVREGVVLDFTKVVVADILASASPFGSSQTGLTSRSVGSNGSLITEIPRSADLDSAPYSTAISTAGKALLRKMFGAFRSFDSIQLLSIDEAGGDSWGTVWGAVRDEYDFYAAFLCTSDSADMDAAATAISALPGDHMVFCGLDTVATAASATWATDDLGSMTEAEKAITFVTFHDANIGVGTEADFAEYGAIFLTSDFDTQCPGGNMFLRNTASLGSLSANDRAALASNKVNFVNPFTSNVPYMHPGVTLDGKGVYTTLTKHWFRNRARNALALTKAQRVVMGLKFPMTREGQALGVAALQSVVDKGLAADHIMSAADVRNLDDPNKPQPYVRALPITPEDLAADPPRLRFEVLQYTLVDASAFTVTAYVL